MKREREGQRKRERERENKREREMKRERERNIVWKGVTRTQRERGIE